VREFCYAALHKIPTTQTLDAKNIMNKKGLIFATIHLSFFTYIVYIILSGSESSWPMLWQVFFVIDFPASIGIYIFSFFELSGGATPLEDIANFWVPALYFGVIGTVWWYFVIVYGSVFIKWIRNK